MHRAEYKPTPQQSVSEDQATDKDNAAEPDLYT